MTQMRNVEQLAEYLGIGQIIGMGNASVVMVKGTYAYVLEITDEIINICGSAPVDTNIEDMTSN